MLAMLLDKQVPLRLKSWVPMLVLQRSEIFMIMTSKVDKVRNVLAHRGAERGLQKAWAQQSFAHDHERGGGGGVVRRNI